jgi:antitoxin (DNA-binding transcriptional repressor) of toxin-antitoxin stability system
MRQGRWYAHLNAHFWSRGATGELGPGLSELFPTSLHRGEPMASVQEIRPRLRSQRIEVLRSRIEPLASEAMTGHLHAWLRQAFSDLAMAVARAVVGFADQQHRGSGHERSCGNTKPGSNVASPSSSGLSCLAAWGPSMHTVNVHEAKTQFSRLIDAAHAGETILVAKDGKPWGAAGAAGNGSAPAAARAASGPAAASPHRCAARPSAA